MGAATAQSEDDPGASRLLADASLIVQKSAEVVAEPLLSKAGRSGITALAKGAGLLVVGLSERWRQEGLGQVRSRARERSSRPAGVDPERAAPGRARAGGDAHALRLVPDRGRAVIGGVAPGAYVRRLPGGVADRSGGMGVVYLATDLSLERPVALKLIAPELAEDQRFRDRFLKEPRLAAALDHPSAVPNLRGRRARRTALPRDALRGGGRPEDGSRTRAQARPERALGILAQVAGALDAAHRRGLVHRDVKPANVLIDEGGHAYLTDFGITKQLGARSTDTGRLVGTLDYLAPEQIRGEAIDGRTDCYSLTCVLYECLSGAPPFRRDTEAETMWAHMQEEPAPLRGHPALAPVLGKALAKERDERYPTCSEAIDAARKALGLGPSAAERLAPPALVRRRRSVLAAGLLVLAAAVTAGVIALTTGGDSKAASLGDGVAALDAREGGVASLIESETTPGNVAVGEGAVWVLNNDESVSRIDPETRKIVRTFKPGGLPAELAAGAGAVWIGNAGGRDITNAVVSVSRVDPESSRVTRTVKLPGGDHGVLPTAGLPRIAVGAGAVWAINPDGSVSRIDPATGRLVARIDVESGGLTIAAGNEGVWVPDDSSVRRIDPRTNRVSERIPVGTQDIWGLAVGAGSVWATARREGLLWRIEPGRDPVTRTIDVGVGVTFVSFGAGAAWTGNYIDGVVSRIDPGSNTVTARTSIGAPQALAAGAGAAWVSVAGGTTKGAPRRRHVPRWRVPARRTFWWPPTSRSRAGTARTPGRWRTRSASYWNAGASGRVNTRSATTPATWPPRRPAGSSSASARQMRTRTRTPSSWLPWWAPTPPSAPRSRSRS